MLQFYFDFLVKFFDSTKFELAQMDTDSLYFGISSKTLESILKPEMRATYFAERHRWLPSEHCDHCFDEYVATKVANRTWTLKPCCEKQLKSNKRMPGLFKLEFKGNKILHCVQIRIFVLAITKINWHTKVSKNAAIYNSSIIKKYLNRQQKLGQ